MNISLRHLAAFAVLALGAASFAGCAAEPQPDPTEEADSASDENVGEVGEAVATCCQEGTVRCASNGYLVEYGQPGCGLPTHTTAITSCKSHCGGVSCIDSGWQNVCL